MAPEPGATPEVDPTFDDVGTDLDAQGAGFPDPLERVNRGTLKFNQQLDHWVLDPTVTVYRFVVPELGRQAVRNVLANLNSPATLVNDLLQLEFHDAGLTTARFILNSTIGIGGIFDVGKWMGSEGHHSDFGQTLARTGVASGPYLVLPVFGPSTLRDTTGSLVDFLFRPTTYVFFGADQIVYTSIQGTSSGLAEFDSQQDNLDRLEESSVDFYAALRSAYYQNRVAEIRRDDPPPETVVSALP